jgi:hypothetical protein
MKQYQLQLFLALFLVLWLPTNAAGGHGRGPSLELGCAVRDASWVRGATCADSTAATAEGIEVVTPGSHDFFRYWSEFSTGGTRPENPSAALVVLNFKSDNQAAPIRVASPIRFLKKLAQDTF